MEIRLERVVAGSPEEVWRAWTDPDVLASWFGPGEFTIPSASMDVRVGGSYEIVMQPPGGGAPMPLVGSYREVSPPDRLVFTWSWSRVWAEAPETVVVVELSSVAGGTLVVVRQGDFEDADGAAPFEMGWTGGLAKLAGMFETEEARP